MQVTLDLPDELSEQLDQLPERDRFIAEALARALPGQLPASSPSGQAPIRFLSAAERRRWADALHALLQLHGQPVPIEALQKLSRESGLGDTELSRALIAARDE